VRGGRQHFTHSKVMAWVAFDRAATLAAANPAMLVFVADLLALGIVVFLAQVQPVDAAGRLQDQHV
jgi:hypothetical protein